MYLCVHQVLRSRPVAQIAQSVVIRYAVQVTSFRPSREGSDKGPKNQKVDRLHVVSTKAHGNMTRFCVATGLQYPTFGVLPETLNPTLI